MTLNGIDVSSWQAGINLSAVPGDFVIVKTTGGVGYVNPAADATIQAAKRAGKLVGIYHFAHEAGCQGSAAAEAAFFLQHSAGYLDGKTMLVLDWEGDNENDTAWALAWLLAVQLKTGVRPLIYMNAGCELNYDWSAVVRGNFGLWLAQYPYPNNIQGFVPPAGPPRLTHWSGPAMWQYTSGGHLPGYAGSLDLNIFYGDRTAWAKYCSGSVIAPQSGPTPAPRPAPKPAPKPAPANGGGPVEWIVDPGNTMSYIAAAVGVSLASLIAVNPGVNPNVIHVGQHLRLPAGAKWPAAQRPAPRPAPAPAGPTVWIVDPGNTMSWIAAQVGVPLRNLIAANPGVNPNRIYPGQRLHLPAGSRWPR